MTQTIAVAMSGGIDSLVAAALLREEGVAVVGVHFFTGYDTHGWIAPHMLRRATEKIGIPLETVDCSETFHDRVVVPFVAAYQQGKTPNPCMLCNRFLKFGVLWERVRALGADVLATGHYARIEQDLEGNCRILRGADRAKDQSYFLALLSRRQIAVAKFPLGALFKSQVREYARVRGLAGLAGKESRETCFVKEGTYAQFLADQPGFRFDPGPIVDIHGNLLGTHQGLHAFTIGQRRGIGCPAKEPYYVVRIEAQGNRLVVGTRRDLLSSRCTVTGINWTASAPNEPIRAVTQIRYRHRGAASMLIPTGPSDALVLFDAPQNAVTPGQGAVFYREESVMGGGFIAQ